MALIFRRASHGCGFEYSPFGYVCGEFIICCERQIMPTKIFHGPGTKGLWLATACFLAPACSGSSELTCDVLADPSNCWNQAAAAAYACVSSTEIGVLASDRLSCSYSDGTLITFDEALPQRTDEVRNLDSLGFTVLSGGTQCARFVDTLNNRLEIEAGGASAVGELLGGEFTLSCGDGSSFSTEFGTLFDCEGNGVTAPTDGFQVEPSSFEFFIRADVTSGRMFRCETN